MLISIQEAAMRLIAHQNIRILTHQSPDGDTIGCAGALCMGLHALGKRVQICCNDPFPDKYNYITGRLITGEVEPDYIVAVDVADRKLLGRRIVDQADRTDLCIDHHASNTEWAKETLLDAKAGAACEVIALLLKEMGVEVTPLIADCLYTGMCTDTGCFRYSNTTPRTLRLAAELMEAGAQASIINLNMFEIKSRSRMQLERMALDTLRFAFDNQVAVMVTTREMMEICGADEGELEGLAPIPRNIEGVRVGITLRERAPEDFKISVRTDESVNATELCQTLGGGGHARASGCRLLGKTEDVIAQMLAATAPFVEKREE